MSQENRRTASESRVGLTDLLGALVDACHAADVNLSGCFDEDDIPSLAVRDACRAAVAKAQANPARKWRLMMEDRTTVEPPSAGRRVDAGVHTPGPWTLKSRRCAQGCCTGLHDVLAQYDDDEKPQRQVATVNGGNAVWLREGETEGNAALIAAAPELLAMCRVLLRRELEMIGSPGSPFAIDDVLVGQVEALIAKATHLVV